MKNIKLINRKIYLNKLIDAIGTPAIQVNLILYGWNSKKRIYNSRSAGSMIMREDWKWIYDISRWNEVNILFTYLLYSSFGAVSKWL